MEGKFTYSHIVVAAGSGSRFDKDLPKQFHILDGKPVLMHTIDNIRCFGRGGEVITVLSSDFIDYWLEICSEHRFCPGTIVTGGETRWHSVKSALALVPHTVDFVTVHDGARPLISRALMDRLLDSVESGHKAVVPVVKLRDSLRKIDVADPGNSVCVDREIFRAVQTPQVFDKNLLIDAYGAHYRKEFTDDAAVVESRGYRINLVKGEERNIKITFPIDLKIAQLYLSGKLDGTA